MAFGVAQWDKPNGDFKCSRWRVPLWAQLNPGLCSSVGEGRLPLPRQSAPTEVTLPLLTQPAIAEATHHNRETAAGRSFWQKGEDRSSRAEPAATGQTSHQQGGASAGKW